MQPECRPEYPACTDGAFVEGSRPQALVRLAKAASLEAHSGAVCRARRSTLSEWLLLTPEQQRVDLLSEPSPLPFGLLAPAATNSAELRLWAADTRLLGSSPEWRVGRAVTAVKQRKGSLGLSLKALGPELGVTARHLGRQFRAALGTPFRSYLRAVRMVNAVSLLQCSSSSVKGIAALLGYAHVANFCNEFQDEFRLRPTEYRNQGIEPISNISACGFQKGH